MRRISWPRALRVDPAPQWHHAGGMARCDLAAEDKPLYVPHESLRPIVRELTFENVTLYRHVAS